MDEPTNDDIAREAAAAATLEMDREQAEHVAKDPMPNEDARNRCSFIRWLGEPTFIGGDNDEQPWPPLPVPGTRAVLRANDGKDVTVMVKAAVGKNGEPLRSPVYLCGVLFEPPVHVGKKQTNFLCCLPCLKQFKTPEKPTKRMCGCVVPIVPGASLSNLYNGTGHLITHHPHVVAAPKTEAMLLINKNSDLVPGVQEVDDTITVQNARAQSTRDAIKAHAMSSGGGAVGGSSAVHSTPNIEEQNPLPAPRAVRESLLAGRVAAVATDDDRVAAVAGSCPSRRARR